MVKTSKAYLENEYKLAECEILQHNKGQWPCFYYLRHILRFLRQHPALCLQKDYRELYDEMIVLLILHARVKNNWTKNEPTNQQAYIELLADLENKNIDGNFEIFSIETVNEFLVYRKKHWSKGAKYTKEKYGFIL